VGNEDDPGRLGETVNDFAEVDSRAEEPDGGGAKESVDDEEIGPIIHELEDGAGVDAKAVAEEPADEEAVEAAGSKLAAAEEAEGGGGGRGRQGDRPSDDGAAEAAAQDAHHEDQEDELGEGEG